VRVVSHEHPEKNRRLLRVLLLRVGAMSTRPKRRSVLRAEVDIFSARRRNFPRMTDPEILEAAIVASRMNTDEFAIDVLGLDPRRLQVLMAGDRPMYTALRALCMLIIKRPDIAREIAQDRLPRDRS
jgi:hypothetical protein